MAVRLDGADKLRKALKQFEPNLAKAQNKEMSAALKPITNKARGFMPATGSQLSGWTSASASEETTKYREFPKYDQTEAKRGVKYSTTPSKPNKRGFVSLARIINSSAGGAIYETAGRMHPLGRKPGGMVKVVYPRHENFGKMIPNSDKTTLASLNPNAGKQFIARANSLSGLVNARPRQQGQAGRSTRKMTGRVIFKAFAEDQGKVTAAVVKAIENSAGIFRSRTDGK
jgi:hypothetical protein